MKVMVVDDELVSRKKVSHALKAYGICHEFEDGQSALLAFEKALIEKKPYDLITLDVSMPNMGGMLVLNKIRALEEHFEIVEPNKVAIIMVTSNDEKATIMTAIKQRCDDYVVKPIDPKNLLDRVRWLGLID